MKTPILLFAVIPRSLIILLLILTGLLMVSSSLVYTEIASAADHPMYSTDDDCCDITEKPTKIIFTFDNDGTCHVPPYKDASCSGIINPLVNPVHIEVHSSIKSEILFTGIVYNGNAFTVDATGVTVNDKFPPKITILIKANGTVLQTVTMHTSCSQPLIPGERFGSIIINKLITIKKNGEILECGVTPPPWPICEIKANQYYWQNTITITNGGDNITANVYFLENHSDTVVIDHTIQIPKNSKLEIDSIAAWYANTQATYDQPNQQFKLLFAKDDTVIMSTEFTATNSDDGIHVDNLRASDEWIGIPSIEGPTDIIDKDVNTLMLAQYQNGGAVYPVSICLYWTENFLPINLVSFEARAMNNGQIEIEWLTATEQNNDFFEVYRSADGENFKVIETIPGAGNSNSQLKYLCIDNNPYPGKNYYQLCQVDYDGKSSMSNIVMVYLDHKFNDLINLDVFPNPSKTILNYQIEKPRHTGGQLDIVDLLGRTIYTVDLESTPDNTLRDYVDVTQFSEGVYYISLRIDRWIKVVPFEILKYNY